MKALICASRAGKAYRMLWFSESTKGIYIGSFNKIREIHYSYHADGKRHIRDSAGHAPPDDVLDMAIEDFRGYKQVVSWAFPVIDEWFAPADEFTGETKGDVVVVLGEGVLAGCSLLNVDLFLVHRDHEAIFSQEFPASIHTLPGFFVAATAMIALEQFPEHKAALTLCCKRG